MLQSVQHGTREEGQAHLAINLLFNLVRALSRKTTFMNIQAASGLEGGQAGSQVTNIQWERTRLSTPLLPVPIQPRSSQGAQSHERSTWMSRSSGQHCKARPTLTTGNNMQETANHLDRTRRRHSQHVAFALKSRVRPPMQHHRHSLHCTSDMPQQQLYEESVLI
jgi:hypothetical protein